MSGPVPTGGQPLSAVAVRTDARLTALAVADPTRLRLAELGLRPGVVVRVLTRTPGGGRVLGVGAGRIAVDRSTARALRVVAS
jgi:ferrous iron transport protein A